MATVIPTVNQQQPVSRGPSYFEGTSDGTYHAYTQANPMGVAESAFTNEISPEDAISSDLAPGETVVQVYEVFFPASFTSTWIRVLLCVSTCGVSECLYHINKWCVHHGWMTPSWIAFTKGKMAVTSNRRLIVWTTNLMQKKLKPAFSWCAICCGGCSCQPAGCFLGLISVGYGCIPIVSFFVWLIYFGIPTLIAKLICPKLCAPKVEYETVTSVRCYSSSQIRDIELSAGKVMPFLCGICCCGEQYEASLRLEFGTFGEFNNDGRVRAMSSTEYSIKVKSKMTKNFAAKWIPSSMMGPMIENMGDQLADHSLDYVLIKSSKDDDEMYDREHPTCKAAFEGMSAVYRDLVALAMASRQPVWTKLPAGTPGIMLPRSDALADEFDLSIVSDHDCNAPPELLPLAPGEEILACSSNMTTRTCLDCLKISWGIFCVLFCWTWGYLFFIPLMYGINLIDRTRRKFMYRPGVVVTTHRLTKIEVARKDSLISLCIPPGVLCCCPTAKSLSVRSFFPNVVINGMIERVDKETMSCALLTDAGALEVKFDVRLGGMPDLLSDVACSSKLNKRTAFIKQLCQTVYKPPKVLDAAAAKIADAECGGGTLGTSTLTPLEFSKLEQSTLPLHDGEQLISRFEGKIYEDCGPGCTNSQTWYPLCCLCFWCGIYPKFSAQSVMLTDAGVYFMSVNGNAPWWCFGLCFRKKNFDIFWAPVSKLVASEVSTEVKGVETFCTRLCEGSFIGKNCCPKIQSILTLSVAVADYGDCFSLNCNDLSAYENVRKKPDVVRFRKTCAIVQGGIGGQTSFAPQPAPPIKVQPPPTSFAPQPALPIMAQPPPMISQQQPMMTVAVPEGVVPGQAVVVPTPSGQTVQVNIPAGLAPGALFQVPITPEMNQPTGTTI